MDTLLSQLVEAFQSVDYKETNLYVDTIEFRFKGNHFIDSVTNFLKTLNFAPDVSGKIISIHSKSDDGEFLFFPSYVALFEALFENQELPISHSLLVIDGEAKEYLVFERTTHEEYYYPARQPNLDSWIDSFITYSQLLKLFIQNDNLVEFKDSARGRMLIIDNGKEKNVATVQYSKYDLRVFSKHVTLQIDRLSAKVTNKEWASIFKHHIVKLINSQEKDYQKFTEIFLNIQFLIASTEQDFEIYVSEFSFEKISKALKADKEKYFNELNQSQEKIRSQMISVPLTLGTTVYGFFQLTVGKSTMWFIIGALGIYVVFVIWYLLLYDGDLMFLKKEVDQDSSKFKDVYPKIYNLFEDDFAYIKSKIKKVRLLSNIIKSTLIASVLVLVVYNIFFYEEPKDNKTKFEFYNVNEKLQ